MRYTLKDLIDVAKLQELLDSLDEVHSLPSAIIDTEGTILTATAWQDICTKFHRVNPTTEKKCIESDQHIGAELSENRAHVIYRCPMGLVDTATPIIIEGKHLGNVFTGQLFIEPPDESYFKEQAHKYGFDESEYLAAVRKVPIFTEEQLHKNLAFIAKLARMLAEQGLQAIRQQEALQALQKSEEFNRSIISSSTDCIKVLDLEGHILSLSEGGQKLLEMEDATPYLGLSWVDFWKDGKESAQQVVDKAARGDVGIFNGYCPTAKGTPKWWEVIVSPIMGADGTIEKLLAVSRDMTERKQAKDELQRLNRELSAISNCNKILIHAQDEHALLKDICTVVCEKAGYSFAWVGFAEHDEAKTVRPVAFAGNEDGYLDGAKISWSDTTWGQGPTGTAIRQTEAIYTQDFATDPRMAPWKEKALRHGFHSSIALPLKGKSGGAFGALTVYSSESHAFTQIEIQMLSELADDLAFGITVLRVRKEQALAEKSLAESQSLLHGIIDSTADFIWSVDPVTFSICSYNHGISEYFFNKLGIHLEKGMRPEDLFPPGEYVQRWHDLYRRALSETSFTTEYTTYAGSIILELSFHLLKNDNEVFGISVFGKDITEHKRSTQMLTQTLQLSTLLAELSTQFLDVTVQELDQRIIDSQRSICELLNFDLSAIFQRLPKGVPGFKLTHLYRNHDGPVPPETLLAEESFPWIEQQALSGKIVALNSMDDVPAEAARDKESFGHYGIKSSLVFPLSDKGAKILGSISFAMVREEHVWAEELVKQLHLAAQLFANTLSRKHAEEEKLHLETQLHQAQKMESIGSLAGGIAHDFNNKLTAILGYCQLADMEQDTARLQEYFIGIRKAAEQSADLTRQLLAFARKQTIEPKVLDLNETVSGMLKMLQRLIGEHINLNWHPAPNLWEVKLDPSQVDQVLANLCVNARDAMTDGGTITIETGISVIDEEYCAQNAGFTVGEYVRLSVSDTGSGMDKETLAQIFEPFFTTKVVGEGTGLGLATVYGIVKQNNGSINVYSEPGLGTTFTIYLPRYSGAAVPAPTKEAVEPAKRGQETILLVEDDLTILNITKSILMNQGYTVLAANSPSEAIRLASEKTCQIDLLITDVVMPEMNGRELSAKLKSMCPQLKCLYMSGYTANVIAHHGVLDEGLYFIQKPYNVNSLADKLREVLDNS
ncbi:PocR ligand-binding domain-containing protein [Geomonas agri]|uniref:PocR ligand-binding domain-containing protein n=1 Tax=Geomonas agri TaxID=2873702 RepID=UPI001CD3152A|nr:PocR ligand-binding domain-containing protein [Geomonas agri]